MKKLPLILALILLVHAVHAQMSYKMSADSVYITNGSKPAELNLENSTKSVKGFLYNKGNGRTEFRKMMKLNDSTVLFGDDSLVIKGSSGNNWSYTGNAGTNPALNFIGTTDNQSFIMRTNNTERLRVDSIGNVGIGNLAPAARLHIAGSNTPFKIDMNWPGKLTVQAADAFMKFEGNGDHFMHFQIKDSSAGPNAGAGLLLRNDVNQGLQFYMGSTANLFVPSAALFRSSGSNGLKIASDYGSIHFQLGTVRGWGLADTANIKMTIDSFGVRLRKADVVSYDSSLYQPLVVDKTNGRIFKTASLGAGAAKQSFAQTTTGTVTGDDEATLIGAGAGNMTIPAASWYAGKTYRITIKGFYSTDIDNPAGISIKIKLGSTVVAQSTGTWLGANHTDIPFVIQVEMTCRSTGAAGSVVAMGEFNTGDQHLNNINNGPNAAAIDLSGNQTLDINAKLSDGSAGNKISAMIVLLEAVN
ncbi:MAG TPA: hypothetical protein VIM79_27925 [Niastella sp.]